MRYFRELFTCLLLGVTATVAASEPMPQRLEGTWRITRILPTRNVGCWGREQAQPLVGTTLSYTAKSMRWQGGQVDVSDIATRTVTAKQFNRETGKGGASATFAQLGIHAAAVTEVDFQHEDADITGATTEVPGDSVLMASPTRIVVSACGVYFEATRGASAARGSTKGQ